MESNIPFSIDNPFTKPEIINDFLHYAALWLELTGVFIILSGAVYATVTFFQSRYFKQEKGREIFHHFRAQLGLGILLGLEFLVAADIIGTVAVSPTWSNVGILGVIILIRTFLSMALEIEINGRLPWRQNQDK